MTTFATNTIPFTTNPCTTNCAPNCGYTPIWNGYCWQYVVAGVQNQPWQTPYGMTGGYNAANCTPGAFNAFGGYAPTNYAQNSYPQTNYPQSNYAPTGMYPGACYPGASFQNNACYPANQFGAFAGNTGWQNCCPPTNYSPTNYAPTNCNPMNCNPGIPFQNTWNWNNTGMFGQPFGTNTGSWNGQCYPMNTGMFNGTNYGMGFNPYTTNSWTMPQGSFYPYAFTGQTPWGYSNWNTPVANWSAFTGGTPGSAWCNPFTQNCGTDCCTPAGFNCPTPMTTPFTSAPYGWNAWNTTPWMQTIPTGGWTNPVCGPTSCTPMNNWNTPFYAGNTGYTPNTMNGFGGFPFAANYCGSPVTNYNGYPVQSTPWSTPSFHSSPFAYASPINPGVTYPTTGYAPQSPINGQVPGNRPVENGEMGYNLQRNAA